MHCVFPVVQKFREKLPNHKVIFATVDSEIFGTGSSRPRQMSACLGRKVGWIGPKEDSEVQREFLMIFKRRTLVNGGIYFSVSGDERRKSMMARLLAKRGQFFGLGGHVPVAGQDALTQCLPPAAKLRLQRYLERKPMKQGINGGYFL